MPDRFYHRDGKVYRSVTTVLNKTCPKPALTQWAANVAVDRYAEQLMYRGTSGNLDGIAQEAKSEHQRVGKLARNIGSVVHRFTEMLDEHAIQGRDYITPAVKKRYQEPVYNCLKAYRVWLDKFNPAHIQLEKKVYCEDPLYAGTLDRKTRLDNVTYRGKVSNGLYIIDIKTSTGIFNPEMGMQLAAYKYADFLETGILADGMAILRLDKESGKFGWSDMSLDYEFYLDMFLSAVAICNTQDRLKLDKESRKKTKKASAKKVKVAA